MKQVSIDTFVSFVFIILSKVSSFVVNHKNDNIVYSLRRSRCIINDHRRIDPIKRYMMSPPFPEMPSQSFVTLAESQFELLSSCLTHQCPPGGTPTSKIKSMALYLPQENVLNGQLEFIPTILYPSPRTERIFIATDAATGVPPTIPKTLTILPGFAHAQTLIPAYPFTGSIGSVTIGVGGRTSEEEDTGISVGVVEEVMCDPVAGYKNTGAVLSLPLYHGSRTVGVILTWPTPPPTPLEGNDNSSGDNNKSPFSPPWTKQDADQITRVGYSLGLALQLDTERTSSERQTEYLRVALAENLHQVRNPLQAIRTFGKLLQRKIALDEQLYENENRESTTYSEIQSNLPVYMNSRRSNDTMISNPAVISSLAENIVAQSDRLANLLEPMDSLLTQQNLIGGDSEDILYFQRIPQNGTSSSMSPSSRVGKGQKLAPSRQSNSTSTSGITVFSRENTTSKPKKRNRKLNIEEQRNLNNYVESDTSIISFTRNQGESSSSKSGTKKPSGSFMIGEKVSPNNISESDVLREVVQFPDCISSILTAFQAIAEERGTFFDVQISHGLSDIPMKINVNYLEEALSNIIDNALKYVRLGSDSNSSNSDPIVRVSIFPNPRSRKSGVNIIVSDNGPGIPSEFRSEIFEWGCRGDDQVAQQTEGTGIGLFVAHNFIVEKMGGVLDFLDKDNVSEENYLFEGTEHSLHLLDGTNFRIMLFQD